MTQNTTDLEAVLAERGARYGKFLEHARITQHIKFAMTQSRNWDTLSCDKREALEMIAHKIGRILNGDPEYADNFIDLAGFATLIVKELEGNGV